MFDNNSSSSRRKRFAKNFRVTNFPDLSSGRISDSNTPVDPTLSVKTFLAKYTIPVFDHLSYLLDVVAGNFYPFLKVTQEIRFLPVKEKVGRVLKKLVEKFRTDNRRFAWIVGIKDYIHKRGDNN